MVEKIPIWLVWVWFREYVGKDVIWTPQLFSVDLEELVASHHKKALESQFGKREDIRVEIEPREANHMYADCMYRRLHLKGVLE